MFQSNGIIANQPCFGIDIPFFASLLSFQDSIERAMGSFNRRRVYRLLADQNPAQQKMIWKRAGDPVCFLNGLHRYVMCSNGCRYIDRFLDRSGWDDTIVGVKRRRKTFEAPSNALGQCGAAH